MKMKIIVERSLTRIFADGQLVSYFMYADEREGIKIAENYRRAEAFLADLKEDNSPIEVLKLV